MGTDRAPEAHAGCGGVGLGHHVPLVDAGARGALPVDPLARLDLPPMALREDDELFPLSLVRCSPADVAPDGVDGPLHDVDARLVFLHDSAARWRSRAVSVLDVRASGAAARACGIMGCSFSGSRSSVVALRLPTPPRPAVRARRAAGDVVTLLPPSPCGASAHTPHIAVAEHLARDAHGDAIYDSCDCGSTTPCPGWRRPRSRARVLSTRAAASRGDWTGCGDLASRPCERRYQARALLSSGQRSPAPPPASEKGWNRKQRSASNAPDPGSRGRSSFLSRSTPCRNAQAVPRSIRPRGHVQ